MQRVTLRSGVSLAVDRQGTPGGTPLIFVHGFAGRAAGYQQLVDKMRDRYDMLLVDHRGHGDSDKPVGDTYDATVPLYRIQQFRDDLIEVIETTGFPTPFVVFGHSMGGMISQEFVLARPDLVSHLVLASTLPTYYTNNMVEMLGKFKSGEMEYNEELWRMMSSLGYTVKFARANPAMIEEEITYKRAMPKWAYIACIENFVHHFDVRERLHEITAPTLVITGNRDALIDWHNSEFLASKIPGARLVVIPKQNHATIREVPDVVAAEIDALVTGASPP